MILLDNLQREILQTHNQWKTHNVSYTYHTGYESEYDDGDGNHSSTAGGLFSSFFSRSKKTTTPPQQEIKKNEKLPKIKGIYMYGSPGCGKTFMMDMFFESINILEKKRVHYNEFMLNIHEQMHRIKSVGIFLFPQSPLFYLTRNQ